jgi:hypothetical protein
MAMRGRPPAHDDPYQQAGFRLSTEMIERLDRHAERMRAATPGVNYTRADALRSLLADGLSRVESESA